MNKLLLGLIFIVLDFDLTSETGTVIGLLPDVVGYIIMLFGLREMGRWSDIFPKGVGVAMGAAFASGVLYAMELFGAANAASMMMILLEIVELVMRVILLFILTSAIRDLEAQSSADLRGKTLRLMWICLAVVTTISYVCSFIPVINGITALAAGILAICYLVLFYLIKVRFDEHFLEEE